VAKMERKMKPRKIFACQNCVGEMKFKQYSTLGFFEWWHIYGPMDSLCFVGIDAWDGEDGRLPVETVVKRLI
jgi:hypothetical protein